MVYEGVGFDKEVLGRFLFGEFFAGGEPFPRFSKSNRRGEDSSIQQACLIKSYLLGAIGGQYVIEESIVL